MRLTCFSLFHFPPCPSCVSEIFFIVWTVIQKHLCPSSNFWCWSLHALHLTRYAHLPYTFRATDLLHRLMTILLEDLRRRIEKIHNEYGGNVALSEGTMRARPEE